MSDTSRTTADHRRDLRDLGTFKYDLDKSIINYAYHVGRHNKCKLSN